MMLRLILTLGVMMIPLGRIRGAPDRAFKWDFGVHPSGQPRFVYILFQSPSELLGSLRLEHRLVFDGRRYESRLVVPQLSSSLVWDSDGLLKWTTPSGRIARLAPGQTVRMDGVIWTIRIGDDGEFIAESADASRQISYRHCVPVRMRRGAEELEMIYDEGFFPIEIKQIQPATKSLLRLVGKQGEGELILATLDEKWHLLYNADHQLIRVAAESGPARAAAFDYQNGLLASASADASVTTYVWSDIALSQYHAIPVSAPPIVAHDGNYDYNARLSDGILTIFFKNSGNPAPGSATKGYWQFDLASGEIKITLP